VRNHPEDVLEVAVASQGVLIDIDAPEDYEEVS
jgi:CTP:molybdopterin cytidylyltransferase MocA